MKTIFVFIVSTLVIVSGTSPDASDDYLKKITENIFNETEHLKRDVESTLGDIKKVNASVPEFLEKIPSIVSKNEAILDIQETLNNTKLNKGGKDKCQKIFDEKVKELSSVVSEKVSKMIQEQFEDIEKKLSYMEEDLVNIENLLKNDNLAKEIEACQEYGYHCMITEAGIPNKDKYLDFIDEVKKITTVLIGLLTNSLNTLIIPSRAEEIVFDPVNECLKKMS